MMSALDEGQPPSYVDGEAPPPAYTTGGPLGPSPYSRLPLAFNIYHKGWTSKTYYLGEHEEQIRLTVTLHTQFGHKKPFLILHDGNNPDGPILGTVTKESLMNAHTTITVPGRPGSSFNPISEHLGCNIALTYFTFTFSFDVGIGKDTRRERFEWRSSRGGEVKALDKWSWGWKLVRLGAGEGSGGSRSERSAGETSDGKQIVAVWAENSKWTMSKCGKFHFIGAGSTGELGEEWAFMAVMTALRLWDYLTGSLSTGS
ncbi:hypothetical protein B0J13DRAFT_555821 [Dactylonectria estremocensis]|uniref:Uncharacterized protein n=1 Tax=Dactylonectria estremocensis TaxID=1079267 RepID=A0A9P9ESD4_9HYPO|nr:hypothetical protein B0J13DRAFT_555821 [Dactylonectria estremocensis]